MNSFGTSWEVESHHQDMLFIKGFLNPWKPAQNRIKTKYLILDMNENGGFGNDEYDVMNNSCNTFTAALSKR